MFILQYLSTPNITYASGTESSGIGVAVLPVPGDPEGWLAFEQMASPVLRSQIHRLGIISATRRNGQCPDNSFFATLINAGK